MKIFAISDLHISTNSNKPMEVFGGNWVGYMEKIRADWKSKVGENDVVLIGGDISWAMDLPSAIEDLKSISDLPGKKVLIKGNHDYWWSSISKVRDNLPENFYALQNDCIKMGEVVICGSRLWSTPGSPDFSEQDEKLYNREGERLRLSLQKAKEMANDGDKIIALVHYPPFNVKRENSLYTELFEKNGVDKVIYGHLHGKNVRADKLVVKNGIEYYLTSCDQVDNKLTEVYNDMEEQNKTEEQSTKTSEVEKECETAKTQNKFLAYLKALPKRFFITAFSGMAQGLFVTLIAGTILALIASWIGDNYIGNTLKYISNIAKSLMGAGIGVGIAHSLGKNKLLVFSSAVAGMVGAFADKLFVGANAFLSLTLGAPGNPIGAYVVTMLVVELVSLYAGKTKLDIILIPLGTLFLSFVGVFISYPFIWLINQLGVLIALATNITPFFMGIIVAVIMGVLLTMPTSSAAIWVAVSTPVFAEYAVGSVEYTAMLLAGGAATVGCACHMVGFAVASFRENGFGGLISQGLGTSMLQIPNIMKKPVLMMPMIISSAICGPLSTCLFKLMCGSSGGGMGTSGLVGVFDLFANTSGALGIIGIILLMFVLPIILNLVISEFMRKKNWIKFGDMKLPD